MVTCTICLLGPFLLFLMIRTAYRNGLIRGYLAAHNTDDHTYDDDRKWLASVIVKDAPIEKESLLFNHYTDQCPKCGCSEYCLCEDEKYL